MVGTTRSRVSFFMNRFRKLGLIEYNGRIQVHSKRVVFPSGFSVVCETKMRPWNVSKV